MFTKRFPLISTIVVLTLLVSACGAPATTAPSVGPQPTAAPTQPPAPTATPTPKVVVFAYTTTFPDIDPSTSFSNDSAVLSNLYEPLVWYNPPGSAEVLSPALATSWESSPDSLTWTFHLRQGVQFHDGTPFNADAVKFSIERAKRLQGGAYWIWDAVNEIELEDEYTVVFHLDYAVPLDLVASSGYAAWMISPSVGDTGGDWFNEGHDAGTGPYTIERYEPGQRVILTRFDDYWGSWVEGQFDKAVLEVVEDPTVRQQKIESGEADWTYEIPTENLKTLDARPDVKVVIVPAFQNLVGLFNSRKPPLDNPRVRQALSYAFPYETFLNIVMEGLAVQSHGPVPTGMFGHDPTLFQYTYDLDQARSLLAEAGYPDGGLEVTMTYATGDTVEEQAGELWKAELAKIGITLNLQPMAWEAQWDLGKGDPANAQDVFVMYWWPTYVTPYDFLFNMFYTEEETLFNLGYYSNPEFDTLINEANEMIGTDKAAAETMFKQAQRMLVEEAASMFFFDQDNIHVIREDITGYLDNPAYPHVVFIYQLSK